MKQVKWKVPEKDFQLIRLIVKRALKKKLKDDALSMMMDLTAAHANGCRLDLKKLLEFPEFDFWHDIRGIERHINRETGKLEDCFLPRCFKRS